MRDGEEDVAMPSAIAKYFSLLLLVVGIIFYVTWTAADPSTWNDVGVYSVTVIFVGFGLAGYWHFSNMEEKEKRSDL